MKKLFSFVVIFCFSASFLFASKVVTDQLGREVVIPDKVERVVVLQHQSVDVIIQLNATGKIVGVLKGLEGRLGKGIYYIAPELKGLPTPGDLNSLNVEEVLLLKPDVVITTNYIPSEFIKKLEELKIPVIGMSFRKTEETELEKLNPIIENEVFAYDNGLYEGVELLGVVLDRQKEAKELVTYIKDIQAFLKGKTAKIEDKSKVTIYMANPKFATYGRGKYLNVMFLRAGALNVAAKSLVGFGQSSLEELLSWNPDVILVQDRYPDVVDELKNNKALAGLKAIKNNKIILMPEYAKAWGYPTPEAMSIGELWLGEQLYPENFKDIDMEKIVSDYYKKFYRVDYTQTLK
ncbi:MAG: ABC transporter substrate-binding protein [Campylobacteraceae bacterium]